MLDSLSLNARYGACKTLEFSGDQSVPAVPGLIALLDHEDMWLRCQAAPALGRIGPAALPALPKLLDMIAKGLEVKFAPKKVNWLIFRVERTKGTAQHIGLSEIAVFGRDAR